MKHERHTHTHNMFEQVREQQSSSEKHEQEMTDERERVRAERDRERAGHLHSNYYSLRRWGDDRLHFTNYSAGAGEMATLSLVEERS